MSIKRFQNNDIEGFGKRLEFFQILMLFCALVIIIRMWGLQITEGESFKKEADNNRIRTISEPGIRGNIFDRNGTLLAFNRPSFTAELVLENIPKNLNKEKLIKKICTLLDISSETVSAKVKSLPKQLYFQPIVLKKNLERGTLAYLEEHKEELTGVEIKIEHRRFYPFETVASHLIGYIGEASQSNIDKFNYLKYGALVGKSGVEKYFDRTIRGEYGWRKVVKDSLGREKEELFSLSKKPERGKDICLTVDLPLQIYAEGLLGNRKGSIVAMNPKNGDILIMASHPSFDPNLFAAGLSAKEWRSLFNDTGHPLQNRAVQSQYPSGSVFKIVTAIAAMNEGLINEDYSIICNGSMYFGNKNFLCWKKEGHGSVDIYRGIMNSCNVFFYNLGKRLDVNTLARYSRYFGLGEKTGVELPFEERGLVPDSEWKLKFLKKPWIKSETLFMAIGQGYLLVTPIQLAKMVMAVANDGVIVNPDVIYSPTRQKNNLKSFRKEIPVKKEVFDIVKEGLINVVNSGTGWRAKVNGITIAGKTGTAQVISLQTSKYLKAKGEFSADLKDHAWFVAFAPAEDPQIVLSILVENGGFGGEVCAPIAKELINFYFNATGQEREKLITDYSTEFLGALHRSSSF
ncbi:MAG: penicillin-binding protein 2 [Candidatus Schekmanbacteria bacterium RIFCSPHIGHO2_02_FULL_38_11]|nr:MAG: penicillin-binding protein 2 [Candidatus Schekmanbacteria bacterium RIFCSPHIGHO2_02_FULL_38_11]